MSTRRERKNDVPFGVRAIESGIEVDGVWISRGNTPVSGSPVSMATRTSPPKSQRRDRQQSSTLGSTSSIPDLAMPQPAYPIAKPISGRSTNASSRSASPNSRLERSRGPSPERHSPMRGLSPQLGGEFASHARQSYRPRQSSHLRYSSADVPGSEDDVVTDYNIPPQHHLRCEDHRYSIGIVTLANLPSDTSSGSGSSLSPEPPVGHYMPTKPSPTKAAAQKSLIVPRTVSPRSVSPIHSHDGQFSFERIPLNNMSTPSSTQNDPFLTPRESPTEDNKDYFNDLPSFQNYSETVPRNSQRQDLMGNSSSEGYEDQYPDHTEARTLNGRDTDVIRRVNSGFEILRPGTLGNKTRDVPETYQPTGGEGNKRPSRKLQKRVRSSTSASRRSNFSEDIV